MVVAADTITPVETMDLTGEPALDFVNTGSRLLARHRDAAAAEAAGYGPFGDRLVSYADLVMWAERAGVIDVSTGRMLRHRAAKEPRAAAATLRGAVRLREALYRILMAEVTGTGAGRADLDVLQQAAQRAGQQRDLERAADGYKLAWRRTDEVDSVVWPVATAALELLLSAELTRVKSCASDDCNWLFWDASKNRSRRWCEMSACGNRAKARRYQARHR